MNILNLIKSVFTKKHEYFWVGNGKNPLRHLGVKDITELKSPK